MESKQASFSRWKDLGKGQRSAEASLTGVTTIICLKGLLFGVFNVKMNSSRPPGEKERQAMPAMS